jgi:CDGSH-type Zn-finger protein
MADEDVRRDPAEAPQLRFYPNGPILVRGAVELVAADGTPIPQRRRVVALCRCGHSALNPLCDGTHKLVRRFQPDGSTACD